MESLAKKLRQQSTDAERLLWKYLRAHRMAGYKFRRQVVIEPYIVDFVCLEARLIVEAVLRRLKCYLNGDYIAFEQQIIYDENATSTSQSMTSLTGSSRTLTRA